MSEDTETDQKIQELLQMLFESISEFLDQRVAPVAQKYTDHFLGVIDELVRNGTAEQFESEGTRFAKALEELEVKLKAEFLEPSQMQIFFGSASMGRELHSRLETAIRNRVNDVAAPAFDKLIQIVKSGRFK